MKSLRRFGGFLRKTRFRWITWLNGSNPIHVDYHGYQVWELPPNGQGIVALMALNVLNNFNFERSVDAECVHTQMEALKMAFADAKGIC